MQFELKLLNFLQFGCSLLLLSSRSMLLEDKLGVILFIWRCAAVAEVCSVSAVHVVESINGGGVSSSTNDESHSLLSV